MSKKRKGNKLLYLLLIFLIIAGISVILSNKYKCKDDNNNNANNSETETVTKETSNQIITISKPKSVKGSLNTGEDTPCPIYKITRKDKATGQVTTQNLNCVATAGFNPFKCKCCEIDVMTGRKMKYFTGPSGNSYCIPEYDSCYENICDNMACLKSKKISALQQTECKDKCRNLFGCKLRNSGLNKDNCTCCLADSYDKQMVKFQGVDNSYCISENKVDSQCEQACTIYDSKTKKKIGIDQICLNSCKNFPKCKKEPGLKKDSELCCEQDFRTMKPMKEVTGIDGKKYCVIQNDVDMCRYICNKDESCQEKCLSVTQNNV